MTRGYRPISHKHCAAMIAAMLTESRSSEDLAEMTGVTAYAVRRFIKALRTHEKTVYIAKWDQASDGRYKIARYRVGKLKDAPRPRKTAEELLQRRRLSNQQSYERSKRRLNRPGEAIESWHRAIATDCKITTNHEKV